jgi:hypothetical protein
MAGDDRNNPIRDEDDRDVLDKDVEEWAEEEKKRRAAWLSGPSEAERIEWIRRESRRRRREAGLFGNSVAAGPTDEEVREWVENEKKRRQSWLNGPSEAERLAWTDREKKRRARRAEVERVRDDVDSVLDEEGASRFRRDVELARRGALEILTNWPYYARARLMRAGRRWEDEASLRERRPRYRLYDD